MWSEFKFCLEGKLILFNRFDFLENTEKSKRCLFIFWLLGNHGEYDKNTSVHNSPFQQLINRFKTKSGIHFSYGSHTAETGFKEEQKRYQSITGTKRNFQPFHFLKYKIDKDFPRLMEAGIRKEYSMGYAMHEGFRASIARPFYGSI